MTLLIDWLIVVAHLNPCKKAYLFGRIVMHSALLCCSMLLWECPIMPGYPASHLFMTLAEWVTLVCEFFYLKKKHAPIMKQYSDERKKNANNHENLRFSQCAIQFGLASWLKPRLILVPPVPAFWCCHYCSFWAILVCVRKYVSVATSE